MWLEKYVFCEKSLDPTTNHQKLAEYIVGGNNFPLRKYLLGLAYHLLQQVAARLREKLPIPHFGGPWWFLNLWLNLHLQSALNMTMRNTSFPFDQAEDEEIILHWCSSFGEATSSFRGHRLPSSRMAEFFKTFYDGLKEESAPWYV